MRLSEDYNGGFWNFYTLTNGGFYMAPAGDKRMRLEVDGNGFSGEMSADAARHRGLPSSRWASSRPRPKAPTPATC